MKIYFAGEPYSHLEKEINGAGARRRLFSFFHLNRLKVAMRKLKVILK